jgi:capsular exopolysaccharide synthesis family protein
LNDISLAASATGASQPLADQPHLFVSGADEGPFGDTPRESILRQYWRIFWTRRWIIALVIAITMLAGLAIGMLSQRQYAATVTLEIARESARIIQNVDDVQPRVGADQEFYQTQYALLKSRSIAEMVVRDLRLAGNAQFLSDYQADSNNSIARLSQQERERAAVTKVMNNLEVIPVRLSSVVGVRFVSPNPDMAARVANSVGENFIESNLARRVQASAYARQFLESRLGQQRQRLEESERQAVGYAAQQHLINIAPTSRDPQTPAQEQSLTAANLAQLNQSLAEATAARIAAESRTRSGGSGTAAAVSLQNSAVNYLRQRRGELNGEYQRQLNAFGPEYPVVAALRAQINELDRQIQNETARISQGVGQDLQGQYRQALATEQSLSGRVEQLKAELVDQRRRAIQYTIYQRDVDTNRGLYDALLQRYKEVGIAGGVGTNNISIVDQATVPQGPFRPNIPVILMIALIIGGVLGAGAALILEQLQEATILPAEFQAKLGVPLLGSVPRLDKDEDAWTALGDAKAPMTEAYFSILTGLQFSTSHGMPKSLLVTSTQPGEGKSTTSLALARALARVGEKVLLIDADLRNPSLHRTLELPNEHGLSSLLVSDMALAPLVRATPTENLSLLTVGQIPPNPAELLSGPGMERVLSLAIAQFDHVILDGPPILGLADAPLLARAVDGTVFVLEAGRTRSTQARQALDRMFAIRAVIVGAVLTKFDTRHYGYGYGYGYDYAYGN